MSKPRHSRRCERLTNHTKLVRETREAARRKAAAKKDCALTLDVPTINVYIHIKKIWN
jgi:hypothetical protein